MGERISFVLLEDGQEKPQMFNKNLLTVPGTGDIIEDPQGAYRFKVHSVTHHNIFNEPGEHNITVRMVQI